MNFNRELQTNKRVWLTLSIPLFMAAWLLRGGKGGDEPMWELWRVFITHDYVCSAGEMLTGLGYLSLIFAVPALVFGWILQFPVCLVLDYCRRGRKNHLSGNRPQ